MTPELAVVLAIVAVASFVVGMVVGRENEKMSRELRKLDKEWKRLNRAGK